MTKQTNTPLPVTTAIRNTLTENLERAGDIVTIDHDALGQTLPALRIKVKQALLNTEMDAELRTIDGVLHVRRMDLSSPVALPGMEPRPPTLTDVLHSLRPWPDEPHAVLKRATLDRAIAECARD